MTQVPFVDRNIEKGHLRSCDVIYSFLPINQHDGAKDLKMVPNCSPGPGASFDMQHDLT